MGIPLVALGVHAPDPLQQAQQSMQLRALGQQTQQQAVLAPGQVQQQQQQIQAGQLQLQQQQQAVKDQQAVTQAWQKWDGKDPNQLPQLVIKNGGSGAAAQQAVQHITDTRAKAAETVKNDAEAGTKTTEDQIKQNDEYRGRIKAVISAPDDQKQSLWDQEVTKEEQSGQIKPGDMSHTYPGDDKATVLANHFALGSVLTKEALDQQTEKTKALQEQNTAANQLQQRKDSEAALAERARHDKAMESLQGGGAGGGGLDPAAIDQAAARYAQTGIMPSLGMGTAGMGARKQIMNRAAQLSPNGSISQNSAEYKANQGSLTGLQKNFDQVTAFENTAGKNLDIYLNTVKKLDDSGSPWLNKPYRELQSGIAGNPDVAAANTARTTALTEIAKVLNSSNASGVLSDSARNEVSGMIGPNSSLKQVEAAAKILKSDMANRHQAYQEQISDIKGRLGGAQGGGSAQSGAPSANQGPVIHTAGGQATGLTEGATGKGSDGKKYVVKGGVWQMVP